MKLRLRGDSGLGWLGLSPRHGQNRNTARTCSRRSRPSIRRSPCWCVCREYPLGRNATCHVRCAHATFMRAPQACRSPQKPGPILYLSRGVPTGERRSSARHDSRSRTVNSSGARSPLGSFSDRVGHRRHPHEADESRDSLRWVAFRHCSSVSRSRGRRHPHAATP